MYSAWPVSMNYNLALQAIADPHFWPNAVPRLRESCKHGQTEVISKSSNNILATWEEVEQLYY